MINENNHTEKELFPCDNCGNDFEELSESKFCEECEEHKCDNCSTIDTEGRHINNEYMCEECAQYWYTCDSCSEDVHSDDCYYAEDTAFCETCYNELFTTCAHRRCDHVIRMSECDYSYENDYFCDADHFYEYYEICGDCSDTIPTDESYYHEDRGETLCQNCYDDSSKGLINNYSFKPSPVFFKTGKELTKKLFLGFELEIETNDSNENEQLAEKIENNMLYFKEDGSLNNGFEIISHPITPDKLREKKDVLSELLKTLKSEGAKSYDSDTCGMHVHISKDAFNTRHLYRFMLFFQENQRFIFKISQRKSMEKLERWAKFEEGNKTDIFEKAQGKKSGDRYMAVNLENRHTIEVRIFRGTLNEGSFFKNLEFCEAAYYFTKHNTVKGNTLKAFKKYILKHSEKYSNLIAFIEGKQLIS